MKGLRIQLDSLGQKRTYEERGRGSGNDCTKNGGRHDCVLDPRFRNHSLALGASSLG